MCADLSHLWFNLNAAMTKHIIPYWEDDTDYNAASSIFMYRRPLARWGIQVQCTRGGGGLLEGRVHHPAPLQAACQSLWQAADGQGRSPAFQTFVP